MNCIIVATVRPGLDFQGATREHKRRFLGGGWQIKHEQKTQGFSLSLTEEAGVTDDEAVDSAGPCPVFPSAE